MTQFYRRGTEPTIYSEYDPTTNQFGGGISSESQAQKLGVIPDWEASWKPSGATTNIQTIDVSTTGPSGPIQSAPINAPQSIPVNAPQYQPVQSGATDKYVRQETMDDGTVVGYLPDGNWERISGPAASAVVKEKIPLIFQQEFAGLFRGPDGTVWQVGSGQRKGITSRQALNDWFPNQPVQDISAEELAGLSIAGYLNAGKKESLISPGNVTKEKFDVNAGTVYEPDNIVRDTELSTDAQKSIELGELVSPQGRPEVYQYGEGGLRHVTSKELFESMGLKWEDVRTIAPDLLSKYKMGSPITELTSLPKNDAFLTYEQAYDQAVSDAAIKAKENRDTWVQTYIDKITGRTSAASIYEEQAKRSGLPGATDALANVMKTIADKETAMNLAIESESGTPGFTVSEVTGRQGAIRRMASIELAGLYSKQSALQGAYELSYDQAKYATELAYNDEVNDINATKVILEIYSGIASEEDQKVIDKMNWDLAVRKDAIDRERQKDDQKVDLFVEYISKYPDMAKDVNVTDSMDDIMDVIGKYASEDERQQLAKDLLELGVEGITLEEMGFDSPTGKVGGTRSWRNNNPGNIEYGEFAISQGAIGTDGRFAIFPSEEAGTRAMKALLKTSAYQGKTIDDAMKLWSGNGYGADVLDGLPFSSTATLSQLTDSQLNAIMEKMKKREGWQEGTYTTKVVEPETDAYEFSSSQTGRLLQAGFLQDEITLIATDLAIYGVESVKSHIMDDTFKSQEQRNKQVKALDDVLKGLTTLQGQQITGVVVDRAYIESKLTEDQMKAVAKKLNFRSKLTTWATEKENYLDYMVQQAELLRRTGMTEEEIMKDLAL